MQKFICSLIPKNIYGNEKSSFLLFVKSDEGIVSSMPNSDNAEERPVLLIFRIHFGYSWVCSSIQLTKQLDMSKEKPNSKQMGRP